MFGAGAQMNAEITEIAQGVYDARNRVMAKVRRQASAAGANTIVISMLRHTIEHYEYEQAGYRYHYFHVTMNVLGTAIRLRRARTAPGAAAGADDVDQPRRLSADKEERS